MTWENEIGDGQCRLWSRRQTEMSKPGTFANIILILKGQTPQDNNSCHPAFLCQIFFWKNVYTFILKQANRLTRSQKLDFSLPEYCCCTDHLPYNPMFLSQCWHQNYWLQHFQSHFHCHNDAVLTPSTMTSACLFLYYRPSLFSHSFAATYIADLSIFMVLHASKGPHSCNIYIWTQHNG